MLEVWTGWGGGFMTEDQFCSATRRQGRGQSLGKEGLLNTLAFPGKKLKAAGLEVPLLLEVSRRDQPCPRLPLWTLNRAFWQKPA